MNRFKWKSLAIAMLLLSCATILGFAWLFQQQYAHLNSLVATAELQKENLITAILYPNSRLIKQEAAFTNYSEYYFETEDSPEAVRLYLFNRLQEQGWQFSDWNEEWMDFAYRRTHCMLQIAEISCYRFGASSVYVSADREPGSNITTIYYKIDRIKIFEEENIKNYREWSVQ